MRSVYLALFAYGSWGLVPVFWKQLVRFPALELISYRILLSALFLGPVLLWVERGRVKESLSDLLDKERILLLFASGSLIGFNWFLYVWAVNAGHVIETSLGYFINPLLNVFLGTIFLGEKMRPLQKLACVIASAGVLLMIVVKGTVPWIAGLLAFSFAMYGFVRKKCPVRTIPGSTVETVLLAPIAVWLLVSLMGSNGAHLPQANGPEAIYLLAIGPLTTLPLLAFAEAAKTMPLSALGFFQFISPSLQFLQGYFLFHEPFSEFDLAAFVLIWIGLGVFLYDVKRRYSSS